MIVLTSAESEILEAAHESVLVLIGVDPGRNRATARLVRSLATQEDNPAITTSAQATDPKGPERPTAHPEKDTRQNSPRQLDNTPRPGILDVNRWLGAYLSATVTLVGGGLCDRDVLQAKVTEFVGILERFYPRDELRRFFTELLDEEGTFRNVVAMTGGTAQSVGDLARLVNMSRTGFHDKFKKTFGESPKSYLQRYRADLIRHELTTSDEPLKSIAIRYGFNSYEVFSRFCRRMLGGSPGSIRDTGRKR